MATVFLSITTTTKTLTRTFERLVAVSLIIFVRFCIYWLLNVVLFGSMFVMIPLNFQLTVNKCTSPANCNNILTAYSVRRTHYTHSLDERHDWSVHDVRTCTVCACMFVHKLWLLLWPTSVPIHRQIQPEYVPVESLHLILTPN